MQIVVIIPNVNTETLYVGCWTELELEILNFRFFLSLDKLDLFDTKVN